MVKIINLEAKSRQEKGKKVNELRNKGLVPAVIYGADKKAQDLVLEYLPFEKVYNEAGESSLVDLKIDGSEPVKVLVYGVQTDPISGKYSHVDFYRIKEGQKLTTDVELEYFNIPAAVKELGGNLIKNLNAVEIECLPKDLISEIKVDLGVLKTFDDSINVKDLPVPQTVKILNNPDDLVAKVIPSKLEEEKPVVKPEEEIEGEEKPEGEEKAEEKEGAEEKKEGEESAADKEGKKE